MNLYNHVNIQFGLDNLVKLQVCLQPDHLTARVGLHDAAMFTCHCNEVGEQNVAKTESNNCQKYENMSQV